MASTNIHGRLLTILLLSVALFGLGGLPSYAVPRIALGVYEDSVFKTCTNVNNCIAAFNPISAEGGIILSNLKCIVNTTAQNGANSQFVTVTVSGNGHISYVRNAIAVPNVALPKIQKQEFSSGVDKIFAKGEVPLIRATFLGVNQSISMHCNLIGRTAL